MREYARGREAKSLAHRTAAVLPCCCAGTAAAAACNNSVTVKAQRTVHALIRIALQRHRMDKVYSFHYTHTIHKHHMHSLHVIAY